MNNVVIGLSANEVTDDFYSTISSIDKVVIREKLWRQLYALEEKYNTMPMTNFLGQIKFSDSSWPIDSVHTFHWETYINHLQENLPLILLLKITVYYSVQVLNQSGLNFYGHINKFIDVFGKRMANESILSGLEHQLFIPASVITEEKISLWIKNAIQQGDLTSEHPLDIFQKIASVPLNKFYGADFLKIKTEYPWQYTKSNGPGSKIRQYFHDLIGTSQDDRKPRPYKPFSEKVCAQLLDFTMPIVTNYATTLIKVFEIANDLTYRQKQKHTITAEGKLKILEYKSTLDKILPLHIADGYNLKNRYFNELYDIVQAASLWIILITTGLRNVDTRENLLRKCYVKSDDSELLFYVLTDIQKTKIRNHPIPVSKLTIDAIDFLNEINVAPESVNNLVVRRAMSRGNNAKTWHYTQGNQVNVLLRKLSDLIGVDLLDELENGDREEGVAHRCRATMAGWIGTNSPLAVLIVRRLFGHTNGIMPDHYLRHNVHVQTERKKIQRQTYISASEEFAESIVDGNISGGMRNNLNSGKEHIEQLINLEANQNNESLTQGEIRQRLKQRIADVLYKRLSQGEILGLQTPLAFICMRNSASASDSPCAINSNKQQRLNQDIDASFAKSMQMTSLPDLDNCKGSLCQHSFLYDNPLTKILLEQFKYYVSYLKGINTSQINLDIEAENFVNLYSGPLTEVYPDVMNKFKMNNNGGH